MIDEHVMTNDDIVEWKKHIFHFFQLKNQSVNRREKKTQFTIDFSGFLSFGEIAAGVCDQLVLNFTAVMSSC